MSNLPTPNAAAARQIPGNRHNPNADWLELEALASIKAGEQFHWRGDLHLATADAERASDDGRVRVFINACRANGAMRSGWELADVIAGRRLPDVSPGADRYLPSETFRNCADLDGAEAAALLRALGCADVRNADLGTNGLAIGELPGGGYIAVSTNGAQSLYKHLSNMPERWTRALGFDPAPDGGGFPGGGIAPELREDSLVQRRNADGGLQLYRAADLAGTAGELRARAADNRRAGNHGLAYVQSREAERIETPEAFTPTREAAHLEPDAEALAADFDDAARTLADSRESGNA